jgi:hypothetical protein
MPIDHPIKMYCCLVAETDFLWDVLSPAIRSLSCIICNMSPCYSVLGFAAFVLGNAREQGTVEEFPNTSYGTFSLWLA